MGDASVFVTFGANTSELEAAIARQNAALRQAQRELANLARAQAKAGESAEADFGAKMLLAAEQVSVAKGQLREFRSQLASLEGGAANGAKEAIKAISSIGEGGHGTGLGFYLREFHALGDELSSGRYRQAEGTFSNLAVTFLQSNAALIPYVAAAAAAAAAIGILAYKAYEAQAALDSLRLDAAVNGFQLTATAAAKLRDEIEKLGGVNASDAEAIAKPFLQLGQVGGTIAEMLAPAMKQLAQSMGGDVGKAAEDIAKRFVDLDGAGRKYVQTSRSISEAEKENFAQLVASGQRTRAYADLVDLSTRSLTALRNETALTAAQQRDHMRAVMLSVNAGYSLADAEKMVEGTTEAAKAKIEAENGALSALRAALLSASSGAENFASAMQAALKIDTVGAGIKEAAGEIERLKAGLAAAPAGAAAATQEMSRALDIAQQKLKALNQQKSDPRGLGRDLLSQDQDALTHYDNVFRGSEQARLAGHIAMLRQMLGNDQLTTAQQFKLQQDLESSQKQLYDQTSKAGKKAARDVLGASEESISKQIRQQQDLAKAALDHLQAEVKLKQLTPSQGESQSIAALQKEQQAVDALYAKELALAGLTATKKQELANQELAFNDQIALKIQEAQEKAAEASQKAWETAMKQINGAFDSQIGGLLKGTTSFQQAFRNVMASLTEDVVKFFVNWGLEAAENEAKQLLLNNSVLQAHVASNAAMTLSDQTSAAAGALSWVGQALKVVAADAAQTFAGVTAFLAPTMGPAAVGPAAAAQATVMGASSAVASADIGMWSVPQDMLTLVHHNELIAPASDAAAIRSLPALIASLAGGGGGNTSNVTNNWSITSNSADARDVARQVSNMWDRNPRMRPKY